MTQKAHDADLRLLLGFLLEAAAPLPYGATPEPSQDALRVSFGPRELLISYNQVVDRLVELSGRICCAQKAAVISQSGSSLQIDAVDHAHDEASTALSSPSAATDLASAWSQSTHMPSRVEVIDEYGDTRVYLCLAWDTEPDRQSLDMVSLLSRVAFGALRFQRKAASSRRRARWIMASRTLIDALLAGADEEEALDHVAEAARSAAGADAALIFLPSIGEEWACEIAAGEGAQSLVGLIFPSAPGFSQVRAGRQGMVAGIDATSRLGDHVALAAYGPLVVAPITSRDSVDGAIVLLRRRGREPFAPDDLPLTEAFASQTSLALEVASARHSRSLAVLLEDRARISRDLHDFAVQQLFATGMKLEVLREGSATGAMSGRALTEGLVDAMASLEEAVRQIRAIVHDLKESDICAPFAERMEREASRSRQVLGFAPSLLFELDGQIIDPSAPNARDIIDELSARIDQSIADDAVAMVREGLSNVARHAHARLVKIEVAVSGHGLTGELAISVTDDGVGVDPTEKRASGLANMATRARMHGGSFGVGAGPRGIGTSVVWSVPLELH